MRREVFAHENFFIAKLRDSEFRAKRFHLQQVSCDDMREVLRAL